jgi:putative ubiquitin-RnfH superfamily antitoxin RatB of RatAB toxin-antitoxin module
MEDPEQLRIEVAYARPGEHVLRRLRVGRETTAAEAVTRAGLADVEPSPLVLGIFGRSVNADHLLADGDRVEIYRPLQLDPKIARRERAKRQRAAPRKPL